LIYRFQNAEIDCDQFVVRLHGLRVELEPRVLDLIVYLIGQRHRMVPRQELIAHVWNHQTVGSSVLTRAVCLARKALGCGTTIRTVHTRGYQWMTPVGTISNVSPRRPAHGPAPRIDS
jgi:DNA-binding winged helix-turn-helix (wHTH) protein